jgi:hypothetical protein
MFAEKGDALAHGAQLVDQRADLHHLLVRPSWLPSRTLRRADTFPPRASPLLCRMLWRFHSMKKQLLRAQRKDD